MGSGGEGKSAGRAGGFEGELPLHGSDDNTIRLGLERDRQRSN
jgi:hypothetical protein